MSKINYKEDSPNICIAIPLESGNFKTIQYSINDAIRLGAKLLEFRMDYYSNAQRLPREFYERLVGFSKAPLIFTMRSPKEGGKQEIDEKARIELIKKMILAKPEFVDIEANTDYELKNEINEICNQNGVKIIYSYHDFEKTPDIQEVRDLAHKFIESCPGLGSETQSENVLKMIFKANTREDNFIPINLCEEISNKGINIVSFCMGKKGEYSRIFSIKHGGFFSFASMGQKTAPGQVKISKFIEHLAKGENKFKQAP